MYIFYLEMCYKENTHIYLMHFKLLDKASAKCININDCIKADCWVWNILPL